MFLVWLHLLALIVFLGSLVCLWTLVLSPLPTIESQQERLFFLTRSLKVYNPLQIGALGVLLMTGAFRLTALKASYGAHFAGLVGATLAIKLTLAFFVIILTTYQCMGIGLRFVRAAEQPEGGSLPDMASTVRRLKISTVIIVLLTLWTMFMGIEIHG